MDPSVDGFDGSVIVGKFLGHEYARVSLRLFVGREIAGPILALSQGEASANGGFGWDCSRLTRSTQPDSQSFEAFQNGVAP
jgi:hypothetical protein